MQIKIKINFKLTTTKIVSIIKLSKKIVNTIMINITIFIRFINNFLFTKMINYIIIMFIH